MDFNVKRSGVTAPLYTGMRSISTIGLVCLCGGAIAYVEQQGKAAPQRQVQVQAPGTADTRQKGTTDPKTAFSDHPVRILLDYLQPGGEIPKEVLNCDAPISSGEKKIEVEALLATVVDPGRTRLSLALDRQFDAILKAARDSGYQFQDLWLPWRLNRGKDETVEQEEIRESLPGLITFRNGSKLLTVWLVGETPTAGISRAQFRQAACFMKRIANVKFMGVLGPTFSGTLASLQTAIDADLHCPPPNILSGTTTAFKAMTQFKGMFPNFDSMIHNDDDSQLHLGSFFKRQHRSHPQMIVLAESDTAFGNEVNAPDLIRYPREISRLRNAYQSDPKLAAQMENGATGEKRRQLLLPLHDSAAGQDTVPNFSLQTPISLETVLFQIAERLRNGHFDVAVLTGTNVLDTLFLGRFLTLNVPDLRVIVFDSDLLFVHGSDSLDLIGTLSVSTYPLHPQLERASDVFASMSERALYDAARLLLNDGKRGNPLHGDSSPLWLSVVGRGNYWPVAILNQSPATPTLEIAAPTRVWNAVFWIGTLLALCLAWLFLSIPAQRLESDKRNRVAALYHPLSMLLLAAAYWSLTSSPAHLGFARAGRDWTIQTIAGIATFVILLVAAATSLWRSKRKGSATLFAIGSVSLVAAAWSTLFTDTPDKSDFFRAVRSVNLSSGVAPEVPVLFFFLSLAWWSWTNWRRMVLVTEREVIEPPVDELPQNLYRRLIALLSKPVASEAPGLIIGIAATICIFASWRSLTSIETPRFDVLIALLLAANSAALLYTTLGFFSGWSLLRSYLKILHTHSSQSMESIAASVHLQSFWTMAAEDNTFPMALEGLAVFKDIRYAHSKYSAISVNIDDLEATLEKACGHVRKGEKVPWDQTWQIREIPVKIAQQLKQLRPHPPAVEASIAKAVSLFHVAFIKYVLMQLRTLFSFLTVGFLLTACALHSYPFQGAGFLRWWTGILFLAPAIVVTAVWFQMEYDPILAKLSKQKEGLDLRSWERLASAGALPLVAGVSALFPQVGHFLFAWVHPTLSGLN